MACQITDEVKLVHIFHNIMHMFIPFIKSVTLTALVSCVSLAQRIFGVLIVTHTLIITRVYCDTSRPSDAHMRQKLTIIGSDNGLSPGRHQAIIWTNAGQLLIGPLGTNFSEILNEIHTFLIKKMHMKISSVKWLPFCSDHAHCVN